MSTAAIAVIVTDERPKYIVRRCIFCHSRSVSSGFSPIRISRSPQAMLWLNGASMIALTTSGCESASPMPSRPLSVRIRTSTASWLLAVFFSTVGMRSNWQTTSLIFIELGCGFNVKEVSKSHDLCGHASVCGLGHVYSELDCATTTVPEVAFCRLQRYTTYLSA